MLYRRACCRYDRIIANFLAVHCWRNGFDGVRIGDGEFCRMFSVKTLKRARVHWFINDVLDWFPHSRTLGGYTVIRRKVHVSADQHPYDPEDLSIVNCNPDLIPEYDENKIIMSLQEFALGLVGPHPKDSPRRKLGVKRPRR